MRSRIDVLPALAAALLLTLATAAPALAAAETTKSRIVVLPFEVNADAQLAYLHEGLPQLLGERLAEAKFEVAPMERVFALIEQRKIGYLDLAVARDLATLLDAQYAVYGSFSQVGETLSLDVRLVEASGAKPAKPLFVVREGLINILPSVDELAAKIDQELTRREVITEIAVKGTKVLDKDVVLTRLKLQKGDLYDPKVVDEETKRIFDLGYFDDIRVQVDDLPEGKRLTFEVTEKPRIQAIGVEGADELDADDLIAAMSTATGSVLNLKILAEDLNKIRELYRKKGYYLAKVSYALEQEKGSPQARLTIKVEEGKKLYIKEIAIKGAKELDPDDLKDQLALSEHSIISFVTGSGVLKEELLERDAAALEAYYANRGFIEAKIGQPEVDFKEDGIYITFNVAEGRRFTVGTVGFKGDLLETPDKLAPLIRLDDLSREHAYFDRSALRNDAQALTDYYSNYGYAFAETEYVLDVDQATQAINVDYVIKKNQRVYIRRIVVEGNQKTRDNVIRRELRLADGDLFDGAKLRRSNERLNKLNFFETAEIEPTPTSNPSEMDLRVKVKEKATGSITGGVGYSSYNGPFIGIQLAENNLFGKGYFLGVSGVLSSKSTQYNISFTNPNYNDTPLSVGGDVYLLKQDLRDFHKDTLGSRARFSYPIGEYSRLYWAYELDRYDITEVDADAAQKIKDAEGRHLASVGSVSATRDTTDRKFNPSTGSINTLSLDMGGGMFGGDDHYIKPIGDSSYYYPLLWEHIFHWHGQLGFVFENVGGRSVPVFEKFYLGGINSVRGYRTLSPKDSETGDFIGGDKEFFTNFEYIFPLNKEIGLMGVGFFDAGNAWATDDWDITTLRKSVGTGVRWYSPLGPLRLEYAYGLDDLDDQGSQHKIEFSVGQFY